MSKMNYAFPYYLPKIVLFFMLFFVVPFSFATQQPLKIYVSPQGNDTWSGLIANKNPSSTDGPVRTLEKARSIVRLIKNDTNNGNTAIEVNLREGQYFRSESFVLKSEDSGTENTPITWRNYKDENVQIIGGTSIDGFVPVTDQVVINKLSDQAAKNVLQLDLRSLSLTDYGDISRRGSPGLELFFYNQRMQLARWPNEGWLRISDVSQTGEVAYSKSLNSKKINTPKERNSDRIRIADGRPLNWNDVQDIVLHGYWYWDWYDEFLHVKSIDKASHEIHVDSTKSSYGLRKNQRYYALNILEELDRPGEWYLNRETGMLYFWPPQAISQSKVYVSLLSKPLFILDNTQNISVAGLIFEFSRDSAIEINHGSNNLIAGCIVRNVGGTAVKINGGVNNGVTSCDIHDISSSGISLLGGERKSLTPASNFAVNNHIYNYSSWIRTYQPGIQVKGVGNRVAHNRIHDAPHSGIELSGNEHVIEYNDIYRVAKETGDVGAFYMGRDWTQRGNIIRYNYFHHLGSPEIDDVNAIYLDDFTSGTSIYGNVIYKAGLGIKVGGGRDNLLKYNIFIDNRLSVRVDSRGLGWAKYYIDGTNNTLYQRMDSMNYNQPPFSIKYPELLILYDDEPALAKNNRIFNNISFGGKWLNLKDGLDLNVVDVHDNIIFQKESGYKNERDSLLSDENFVDIVDGEIVVSEQVQQQHDINIPDLNLIGNYSDSYRQ